MFESLNLAWDLPSGVHIRLGNYGEWVVYNEIFINGEYDLAINKAFDSRLRGSPLRILDLGANVGFFTCRVVDLLRQRGLGDVELAITAVEGNERSAREFHGRILVENALKKEVRLIHGLVGRRTGSAMLYAAALPSQDSMFGAGRAGLRVEYVNLAPLFADADHIDLLKCDIEGAELLFLQDYPDLLRKIRVAVFEFHASLCDVEQCRRLLSEYGLTHHVIVRAHEGYSIECVWRE